MLVTGKYGGTGYGQRDHSYQSKYGATAKYAKWLQECTTYDIAETKKARAETAAGYDVVILCGGIYASGIAGLSFLRKIKGSAREKIAVFCVGASPYDEKRWLRLRRII